MSYLPIKKTFTGSENTDIAITKVKQSVSGFSTVNRTVLTRDSAAYLVDTEVEQIHAGHGENVPEDLKHRMAAKNFPDVVSSVSTALQSQDFVDTCKDPDVVRSNSSSDEKSLDTQVNTNRYVYKPKFSGIVHSSVSSFSSSNGSKQSTSSFQDQGRRAKTSVVGSFSSFDSDDLQHEEVLVTRPGDVNNFLFNQDSVFAQESEDVFEQPQQLKKMQQVNILRDITSPIMELNSSLSLKDSFSNEVLNCSEKGQKARIRFSSSGYGTGSGESAKGNSASKTSVQLSHELLAEEVAALPQSSQTDINNEELKCVENDLTPRNIGSNFSTVIGLVGPCVHNQADQESLKPQHHVQVSSNITVADTSLALKGTNTKRYSGLSSEVITDGPTASLESQTLECPQQQGLSGQNVPVNMISPQVKKQSEATLQSLRQHQINLNGTTGHRLQALPQVSASAMFLTGHHQQSHATSKRSSTAYTDSPPHIWQSSLQQHLTNSGSLQYNPAHMSSCSSGSCFVPPSVEAGWSNGQSPASVAKQWVLQDVHSGPGAPESSGESRYHLESLIKTDYQESHTPAHADVTTHEVPSASAQYIPNFSELLSDKTDSLGLSDHSSLVKSSLENQFERDLWQRLQRNVRCHEDVCDLAECVQAKKDMAVLENVRDHVQSLCEPHRDMLMATFNHMAYVCDHPKCPFPWCGERIDNSSDQLTREECLQIMKQRMENFTEYCMLLNSPVKYMKLKPTVPYSSMPVEGQDWIRLCMMGSSRRTLLVKPTKCEQSRLYSGSEYWVIKKVLTADDGDHWGLYARLREVNHKSIVTLLWAASFEDHMLVCSVHEGFSLHECLPSLPPPELRFVSIFSIMQQLTSAIRHLNSLDIVYLYWTSKNILVTYRTAEDFVVKLSNFSCSVLLKHPDGKQPSYDGGYLLLALPRHIIMPELRDKIRVELASDVWGLGCLLHELATGYPVWHEQRHILDNDFSSMIGEKPCVPSVCPELTDVFSACWEGPSSLCTDNTLSVPISSLRSHKEDFSTVHKLRSTGKDPYTDWKKRVQVNILEIMMINAYQVHLMC